jgi:SPOR domain
MHKLMPVGKLRKGPQKDNRKPFPFFSEKLWEAIALVLVLMVLFTLSDAQAAEKASESASLPPKDSLVASSGYELQLNSFKVKSNAKRFFDGLVKKGYKPFMVFVQNEEIWFKVRMGPYPLRKTAESMAAEIKEKYGLSSLILQAGKIQSKSNTVSKSSSKQVAAENAGNSIDVVMAHFLVWLKAWQGKQLDSYFSFYSRSFESGGKPLKDWRQEQSKSLDEIKQIKVEVNDLEMLEKGDTVEMSFTESFQSESFSDIRRKVLVWKKEKGVWKIIAESSEPA